MTMTLADAIEGLKRVSGVLRDPRPPRMWAENTIEDCPVCESNTVVWVGFADEKTAASMKVCGSCGWHVGESDA